MGCTQFKGRLGSVRFSGAGDKRQQQPLAAAGDDAGGKAAAADGAGGVDPKLGLTDREVFKLKTSWKAVHRRVSDTGVEMFISNLELSDNIRDNGDLAMHGELVMGILDEAIINIEDIEVTRKRVRRAASSHRKFAGFYAKLFWSMEQPFLDAVRLTLEDRYNDVIAQIYAKTIHYILGEMEAGFMEVED